MNVHELHPVLVHFTIGLLTTSVVLYFAASVVAAGAWRDRLDNAAELNLWLGALVTALTVGAGMIAFGSAPHSDEARFQITIHSWFAYSTFTLFAALAAISAWRHKRAAAPHPTGLFLAGLLVALAALAATGYLGGDLVFKQGVGVQGTPR